MRTSNRPALAPSCAIVLALSTTLLAFAGCGDDEPETDLGEVDASVDLSSADLSETNADGGLAGVKVSGQVIAFENELPLAGSVTVSTQGLTPPPGVSVSGSSFVLTDVIPYSVFAILAGSPPNYRTTYNVPPAVEAMDATGVKAYVVAETTLAAFQTALSVTPVAGKAIVLAQIVGTNGAGLAGVPSAALQVNGAAPAKGPYFLDASKVAQTGLTATSSSGWVVFYDVDPGQVAITTPMASGYTFQSVQAPTSVGLVTVVRVTATAGSAVLPTNVLFATQVAPIFTKRGCVNCHSGNGPGKDLGGLTLNGGAPKIFSELTVEMSPNFAKPRVDKAAPEKSLVLTMPTAETPADTHPNVTFTGPTDADYVMILAWIKEGAKNN